MARSETFVIVYRLEAHDNYDSVDNFIEAISDYAIASSDENCTIIIVVSSDVLNLTKLCNIALKHFGKDGYNISTLGLLGPFKKLN